MQNTSFQWQLTITLSKSIDQAAKTEQRTVNLISLFQLLFPIPFYQVLYSCNLPITFELISQVFYDSYWQPRFFLCSLGFVI